MRCVLHSGVQKTFQSLRHSSWHSGAFSPPKLQRHYIVSPNCCPEEIRSELNVTGGVRRADDTSEGQQAHSTERDGVTPRCCMQGYWLGSKCNGNSVRYVRDRRSHSTPRNLGRVTTSVKPSMQRRNRREELWTATEACSTFSNLGDSHSTDQLEPDLVLDCHIPLFNFASAVPSQRWFRPLATS